MHLVRHWLRESFNFVLVISVVGFVGLSVGCGGGEGDPCKEEDDCQSGLVCCKPGSGGASARGTCEMSCGDTPPPDATVPDATVPDASESDASGPDASEPDASGGDASPADASSADAADGDSA